MSENGEGINPNQEEHFDFEELSSGTQAIYGTKEAYYGLAAKFIQHEILEDIKSLGYDQSLYPPLTETGQFKSEIENPHFRIDTATGINYAVYRLNRDKVIPGEPPVPLVVNMNWSDGAECRGARAFLNALSTRVDQPIIVIDPPATGKTSIPPDEWIKKMDFDKVAESEKRILDQELEEMGATELDVSGRSMGGIRAGKQAVLYGEKVRNLVTVSAPGFVEKNPVGFAVGFGVKEAKAMDKINKANPHGRDAEMAYYARPEMYGPLGADLDFSKIPLSFRWVRRLPFLKAAIAELPPEQFTSERMPAFYRYFRLMTRSPLGDLPEKLSPNTAWADSVGSKEAITDYDDHMNAVRRKKGASLHILGSEFHSRVNKNIETADEMAHLLSTSQRKRERVTPTSQ